MGYTTDFYGEFQLDKPLTDEHHTYLTRFAETRRMKRDASKTEAMPDPLRLAVGLPVGTDGAYYVGAEDSHGQESKGDVIDYNGPPADQPGLWCQWTPDKSSTAIVWDGGEKFYDYVEWIQYLIDHFLAPWGYSLNGEVQWSGEDSGDLGIIEIRDNVVKVKTGRVVYE